MMRDVVRRVLSELRLDYVVTLISGGESGKYEIVMWDKARDSYFSLKVHWSGEVPVEETEGAIRRQLQQRLTVLDHDRDRRPLRRWPAV